MLLATTGLLAQPAACCQTAKLSHALDLVHGPQSLPPAPLNKGLRKHPEASRNTHELQAQVRIGASQQGARAGSACVGPVSTCSAAWRAAIMVPARLSSATSSWVSIMRCSCASTCSCTPPAMSCKLPYGTAEVWHRVHLHGIEGTYCATY